MTEELFELLEKTIEEKVDTQVSLIRQENSNLKVKVANLQNKITSLEETTKLLKSTNTKADILLDVITSFQDRLYGIEEKSFRGELIYKLLDVLFTRTFEESTYDCPTWFGAVVNFYEYRDIVVDLLKVLNIDVPKNIGDFRLPQDWTTEELDIVFDTMSKHIVCNSCTYSDNLRFWKPNALDDVYSVCHSGHYTEIPWQFLLRNPNLLKEKYLKKIGQMAYAEPYVSGWRHLFNIDKYQDMSDEQIKTIIREIDGSGANISKEDSVSEFLLRHLELIEDGILIDKIYKKYWDSYSFRYENRILKMPIEYLELWVKEKAHRDTREALEWIISNKNKFSEEQKNNLLKLVMSEVLK